eukprot:TRINITY_DN1814_c0_g1_i1.p1 TRINITY_DN1814_c0_g1~~TRINITY_DN1814_c0_g1_i1.p1  ORF type:complete len:1206 (-),score=337.30 TRINITY_DN1814_c0_g1_i1:1101-4718(-)
MSALKRRGFRQSVYSTDMSGLLPLEGYLKKKASKGLWKQRYFEVNNHYLKYYKAPGGRLLGAFDICKMNMVSLIDTVRFEISDDNRTIWLKAPDSGDASNWVDKLNQRMEYFEINPPVDMTSDLENELKAFQPLEGYLKKKSPRMGWQKRFFRLTATTLIYSKGENHEPLATIHIGAISDVRACHSQVSSTTLQFIEGAEESSREYRLKAGSRDEMNQWVDRINEACDSYEEAHVKLELAELKAQEIDSGLPEWIERFKDPETKEEAYLDFLTSCMTRLSEDALFKRLKEANIMTDELDDKCYQCKQFGEMEVMHTILKIMYQQCFLPKFSVFGEIKKVPLNEMLSLIGWIRNLHDLIRSLIKGVKIKKYDHDGIYMDEVILEEEFTLGLEADLTTLQNNYIERLYEQLFGDGENVEEGVPQGTLGRIVQTAIETGPDSIELNEGRAFTNSPTDLLTLANQYIMIVRNDCGMPSLEARALLCIQEFIERYISGISAHVLKQNIDDLDMSYVCAVINDNIFAFKGIEEMMFSCNDVYQEASPEECLRLNDRMAALCDVTIQNTQELCAVLTKMVLGGELNNKFTKFFSQDWLSSDAMNYVIGTVSDYFEDMSGLLHPVCFKYEGIMILDKIVYNFLSAFVARKNKRFSTFIIGKEECDQFVNDVQDLRACFNEWLGEDVTTRQMFILDDCSKFLVEPPEYLPSCLMDFDWMKELIDTTEPNATNHREIFYTRMAPFVLKMFELCIGVRNDITKKWRKDIIADTADTIRDEKANFDLPAEALPNVNDWSVRSPTDTYRKLFPDADRSLISSLFRTRSSGSTRNLSTRNLNTFSSSTRNINTFSSSTRNLNTFSSSTRNLNTSSSMTSPSPGQLAAIDEHNEPEKETEMEMDMNAFLSGQNMDDDNESIPEPPTVVIERLQVDWIDMLDHRLAEWINSDATASDIQVLNRLSLPRAPKERAEGLINSLRGDLALRSLKTKGVFYKRFVSLSFRQDNTINEQLLSVCYSTDRTSAPLGCIPLNAITEIKCKVLPSDCYQTNNGLFKLGQNMTFEEKSEAYLIPQNETFARRQKFVFYIETTKTRLKFKAANVDQMIDWVSGLRELIWLLQKNSGGRYVLSKPNQDEYIEEDELVPSPRKKFNRPKLNKPSIENDWDLGVIDDMEELIDESEEDENEFHHFNGDDSASYISNDDIAVEVIKPSKSCCVIM